MIHNHSESDRVRDKTFFNPEAEKDCEETFLQGEAKGQVVRGQKESGGKEDNPDVHFLHTCHFVS